MNRRTRFIPGLVVGAATAIALVGCEVETDTAEDATIDTTWQDTLSQDQMGADQEMYEARLEAVDGSGVTGTATLTIEDEELTVTVAATGFDPNVRVPQHIHMNSSCDDAGGILLNFDDDLSAPNDGEPRGDAYPETNDEGSLRFEATRSISDLSSALGDEGAGADNADTTDTASADTLGAAGDTQRFDFGNRVVNLHGADMQPIACGALDAMDHGQM